MSTNSANKLPIWFWVVSAIAFILYVMGSGAYIYESLAAPQTLVEVYGQIGADRVQARPAWANVLYEVCLFGGVIGCLLLMLRKRVAIWSLLASFMAVLALQFYWWEALDIPNSLQTGD